MTLCVLINPSDMNIYQKKKERDLTQSYDKSLFTIKKLKRHHKDATKTLITQRLQTHV